MDFKFKERNGHRYKIYTIKNSIIAIASFGGKIVRGEAKCSPEDAMNEETGTTLAILRCDEKISRRKLARAKKKRLDTGRELQKTRDAHNRAMIKYEEANIYYKDAKEIRENAVKELNDFLDSLR